MILKALAKSAVYPHPPITGTGIISLFEMARRSRAISNNQNKQGFGSCSNFQGSRDFRRALIPSDISVDSTNARTRRRVRALVVNVDTYFAQLTMRPL